MSAGRWQLRDQPGQAGPLLFGPDGNVVCKLQKVAGAVDGFDWNTVRIMRALNREAALTRACEAAGRVLDSMLNGQGLEVENIDGALSLIHAALRQKEGRQ